VSVTFANGSSVFLYEAPFSATDEDIDANFFDPNFVRSSAIIGTPGFGYSGLNDLNPQVALLANVAGQPPNRALAVWQSGPGLPGSTPGIQERLVDSNGNALIPATPLPLGMR